MMNNRKGWMEIVGTVVLLIVGLIVMVGILVPITDNLSRSAYYTNSTGSYVVGFTGVNAAIANNLVTFVLIGVLLLLVGGLYYKYKMD
jgi:hypothetical protein